MTDVVENNTYFSFADYVFVCFRIFSGSASLFLDSLLQRFGGAEGRVKKSKEGQRKVKMLDKTCL